MMLGSNLTRFLAFLRKILGLKIPIPQSRFEIFPKNDPGLREFPNPPSSPGLPFPPNPSEIHVKTDHVMKPWRFPVFTAWNFSRSSSNWMLKCDLEAIGSFISMCG